LRKGGIIIGEFELINTLLSFIMMKYNLLVFSFFFTFVSFGQTIVKQTMWRADAKIKTKSKIFSLSDFDETITNDKLITTIDTLPLQKSNSHKRYMVLYKEDATQPARMAFQLAKIRVTPIKYGVFTYWPNGNYKSMVFYDNKFRLKNNAHHYYENGMWKSRGHYRKGLQTRKWKYYNEEGKIVKKTKYKKGEVVRTKTFATPKGSLNTRLIRTREKGIDYMIE
jgi:hypothetical protein